MPSLSDQRSSLIGRIILVGLQAKEKNIYQGTVPEGVVAERRRKNKVARKSRRINRRNS